VAPTSQPHDPASAFPGQSSPYESASFRDPSARVFRHNGTVYRALGTRALADWNALSAAPFWRRFVDDGRLVGTTRDDGALSHIPEADGHWVGALRHDSIPVISYPYEWPFGMLQDAALLQLDLLLAALTDGFVLKDGTPYNVQWVGSRPVFIDIASITTLAPGSPWEGYRQFCELCLYPLMLQAYKDIEFHPWLRGRLDGIPPAQIRPLFSFTELRKPGVLTHVVLQAAMDRRSAGATRNVKQELRQAGFNKDLVAANVRRLRTVVSRLTWRKTTSMWSEYTSTHSYDSGTLDAKTTFVRDAVRDQPRGVVWDLGSNTGTFARLAAEHAKYVVAVDADHLSVERLYQLLKREGPANVLPLVGNIADPAPGLGWLGRERLPLPARSQPSLVLCLALVHHVALSANVPLGEFIGWLATLGADVVIEFVSKADAMSQQLLRNKEDVFADYEQASFERHLERWFVVARREVLSGGTRTLYYARHRATSG
jgi:SAM-dependent methyltransferase